MRKWIVLASVVALVAVPVVVFAAARGSTPVNCIASQWRSSPTSTSSTHWSPVAGLQTNISQARPVVINVSALVSGARAGFRVRTVNIGGQHRTSRPGATIFDPGSGPNSFAYQWIDLGNAAAEHSLAVHLQWRSLTGGAVHMLRGDMTEAYATDHCPGAP
jgi:hypothetical protein